MLSPSRITGAGLLVALMAVLGSPTALADTGSDVQCGDTLTASVQLDADLNCTGTALTIAASGVTVDLGGHTVTGTTSGISAHDQTGVTISNGTVGGGISLTRVSSSAFSTLHVDSLSLSSVDSAVVTDSVIQNGRISLQGVLSLVRSSVIGVSGIATASAVIMTDSTVTDSSFTSESTGFTLTGSTLTRSRISGTESGAQVATKNKFIQSRMSFFFANRLDIEDNQFTGADSGLGLTDLTFKASVIKGNVFNGGGVGVSIDARDLRGLNDIAISHNVFVDNSAAGILLQARGTGSTHAITISDNVFSSNGKASNGSVDLDGVPVDDGLHIDVPPASPVTVSDNFTLNNADHGIEAQPGTVIDGGGNISVGDPAGCLGVICK